MHGTMLGSSLFAAAAAILIVSHVEAAPVAPHGEMQIMPTSANDTQQHLFTTDVASTAAPMQYTYKWIGRAPWCSGLPSDCSTGGPKGVSGGSFWTGFQGNSTDNIYKASYSAGYWTPPGWKYAGWRGTPGQVEWYTKPPHATNEFGYDCKYRRSPIGIPNWYSGLKVLCGYLVTGTDAAAAAAAAAALGPRD